MEQNDRAPAQMGRETGSEAFRRVWARVMPDQSQSPLVVDGTAAGEERAVPCCPQEGPGPALPVVPSCPSQPEQQLSPVPSCPPQPEQQLSPVPNCPPMDMPPVPDCGCCGCFTQSQGELWRLEELMDLAKEGMAVHRQLARRMRGVPAQTLNALAEQHRQALRQLSAVYFLILGRRYVPKQVQPRLPLPLAPALRRQFLWEQALERKASRGAAETADPCLKALYGRTAQQAAEAASAIQAVLEGLMDP